MRHQAEIQSQRPDSRPRIQNRAASAARRGLLGLGVLVVSVLGLLTVTAPALGAWVGHEYLSQLTEVPLGASLSGPLQAPQGLAIDSDNNVWVADQGLNVIDEFDSADVFVSQLTGEGQFGGPQQVKIRSVAVTPSTGDVYVAESKNDVIDVFEPGGTFKEAWNGSTTPNKKFGKAKGEEVRVAIDQSTGDVYVASSEYAAIDEFNSAGTYLRQMTGFEAKGVVETFSGSGLGSIAAAGGKLYVLTSDGADGSVIAELGPSGETAGVITGVGAQSSGYGNNAYYNEGPPAATGLAVDSAGDVYVDSGMHDIVEEFDAAGDYVGKISGAATPAGSFLIMPAVSGSIRAATFTWPITIPTRWAPGWSIFSVPRSLSIR